MSDAPDRAAAVREDLSVMRVDVGARADKNGNDVRVTEARRRVERCAPLNGG